MHSKADEMLHGADTKLPPGEIFLRMFLFMEHGFMIMLKMI